MYAVYDTVYVSDLLWTDSIVFNDIHCELREKKANNATANVCECFVRASARLTDTRVQVQRILLYTPIDLHINYFARIE